MRRDMSPRPAFNAVSNLMRLLSDEPGNLKPGKLDWTIQGGDSAGIESALFQKHDGSFWLALWVPKAIYEVDKLHPIAVAAKQVTFSVGERKRVINIWDFDEAGNAAQNKVDRGTVTISVGSAVTLLEIR